MKSSLNKIFEKIQDSYWTIVPYNWRPGQIWYRIKCFLWHRYSTVKPREFPHTWVDRCELMPHMIFEILSQFIEGECGEDGVVDWYYEGGHKIEVKGEVSGKLINVRDEMQDLYDWWHKDYIVNKDHTHDAYHEHFKQHGTRSFEEIQGSDHLGWETNFDTPEAEAESDRLFQEAMALEKAYEKELNSRLHRIINIIPYMWT